VGILTERKIHYDSMVEKKLISDKQHSQKFRLLHDDYDEGETTKGTLTFTDDIQTPESINSSRRITELMLKLNNPMMTLEEIKELLRLSLGR
jgi:hypothetical protein